MVMIDLADPATQAKLLRRPQPDPLSRAESLWYRGRRILITGPGTVVGAELVRRLAVCAPESITLVDAGEDALAACVSDLTAAWPSLEVRPILGDVSRARVIRAACDAARPDVVFHAAGAVQPALLEQDVCAGVLANVIGTVCAVDAARDIGARFVLLSTDRAVRPRSVVGATRRLAELVAMSRRARSFSPAAVRFGEVIGSRAGVLTAMVANVERGEAIAIPAPGSARRFATPAEAALLALRADIQRLGGRVCWSRAADEPVVLADLAGRLIRLAGATRGTRRPIVGFTGPTPWDDECQPLPRPSGLADGMQEDDPIGSVPHAPVDIGMTRRILRSLRLSMSLGDALAVLTDLCAAVPEYDVSTRARQAAGASTLTAMPPDNPGFARLVA